MEPYESEEIVDPKYATANFSRLYPPPTLCNLYGTGQCCFDQHFDMKAVLPKEEHPNLCRQGYESDGRTRDKASVNCLDCIAIMRS